MNNCLSVIIPCFNEEKTIHDLILEVLRQKSVYEVIIIDDLIATGGTAIASAKLVEKCKANVAAFIFLIDLYDLQGNRKLKSKNYKTFKLIDFPGH